MEPLGRLPDGRAKLRGTTLGLRKEDWPRTRQQSPDRQARGREEVAAGRNKQPITAPTDGVPSRRPGNATQPPFRSNCTCRARKTDKKGPAVSRRADRHCLYV